MTKKEKPIRVPLSNAEKVWPFLRALVDVVNHYQTDLACGDVFQVIGALAGVTLVSLPCTCQNCVEAGGETIITALLETLSENGLRAELRENEPEVTPERTH